MKILYGVQATGNGHITRARAMAPALRSAGIEVDFLFSGRPREDLFEMDSFGEFDCRTGLTFASRNGRISTLGTLTSCRPLRLLRDIRSLRFADYNLVVTDYEPITAWGARQAGVSAIGIGHQYAFEQAIPQHRGSLARRLVMRNFAPAKRALGLHWYHFGARILPPIAPIEPISVDTRERVVVVYLPFESTAAISALVQDFTPFSFIAYHPEATPGTQGNIEWHRPGRETFQRDLASAGGVICNAGFELASEALQLGKKLLVKPMGGQPEQASNAQALALLGLGSVMEQLDPSVVAHWLQQQQPEKVVYPDVAATVSRWLANGGVGDIADLSRELWLQTRFPKGFSQMGESGECLTSPSTLHRT